MKDFIQGILLFAALSVIAMRSDADTIDHALKTHFLKNEQVEYLNYESVQQSHSNDYGEIKYLVMDFKPVLASTSIQPTIHQICQTVLKDVPLVTQLAYEGYNMISVSFDQNYQYDCL